MTGHAFDDLDLNVIGRSPIATVVTDPLAPDNPIVAVNDAFERLTGYAGAEVVGRNCRFLAGCATSGKGSKILREAVRLRRPALAEVVNYKRDGTQFRNAVMIAPWYDDEGSLRYFVGSQIEIADTVAASTAVRAPAQGLVATLTPRQRQVLREMTFGYRNKQIAARLGLSETTVKMHRRQMLIRLQAVSSTDAVRIAVEAGL